MSEVFGTLTVLLALAAVSALAIRSLWRDHKRKGDCNGDCCSCGSCGKPIPTLKRVFSGPSTAFSWTPFPVSNTGGRPIPFWTFIIQAPPFPKTALDRSDIYGLLSL